jgi:lipid II:glycine glycyltransferase (peptidoglycan interpeptide bridge formation enzyme)
MAGLPLPAEPPGKPLLPMPCVPSLPGGKIVGLVFAHLVPARRGRHLAVPYGPVSDRLDVLEVLLEKLKEMAKEHGCSFLRLSPFWKNDDAKTDWLNGKTAVSPLHLLAEHVWYLPLKKEDAWQGRGEGRRANEGTNSEGRGARNADELFTQFRATTRNLIRRAEKDGVTITASKSPEKDIEHFLKLHEETRKRHSFTPYTDKFFREELLQFAAKNQATLYMAHYQGEVIASSIHIHAFGETSYHHGASTHKFSKVPASYLLQWTAIQDALKRGDHVYNFWGIAPVTFDETGKPTMTEKKHPFAGVTLFKTGFNGALLELPHCRDLALNPKYQLTKAFEVLRKWRRGF